MHCIKCKLLIVFEDSAQRVRTKVAEYSYNTYVHDAPLNITYHQW